MSSAEYALVRLLTMTPDTANLEGTSIEELLGAPRASAQHFAAADIPVRKRQGARLRPLLPEAIPGLDISRLELEAGGQMAGAPHTPGTREYLMCERGRIIIEARDLCDLSRLHIPKPFETPPDLRAASWDIDRWAEK